MLQNFKIVFKGCTYACECVSAVPAEARASGAES